MNRFVGFYWTLPVPIVGFVHEFPDVETAALRSKTIRYQRDLVRRWAQAERVELVAEHVFMEVQPDRGTPAIRDYLRRVLADLKREGASLVYVSFSDIDGWRHHPHLQSFIAEHHLDTVALPPERITESPNFDPIEHFKRSRDRYRTTAAEKRRAALSAIDQKLAEHPLPVHGRYEQIARELNEAKITTSTGRLWTRENVRKNVTKYRVGNHWGD